MKALRRRLLQASVLAVLAAGALLAWTAARGRDAEAAGERPRPVRTALPERRVIEERAEAWGLLRCADQVTVLPKVAGAVTALFAEVGEGAGGCLASARGAV